MTKVPSLDYEQVVRALQKDGWVIVRQREVISVFRSTHPTRLSSSLSLHTVPFFALPSPIF